jgi:hypothetical protein
MSVEKKLMTTHNFCTLFDSNFLSRGLALFNSLMRYAPDSMLYVYCFDDLTLRILKQLSLPNLSMVSLAEFESLELLEVKSSRSVGEYCWTCTPHIIRDALVRFKLPAVTYLDADLYFFNSPAIVLDEWNNADASVLITEHRYTPRYDNANRFGIYCVQFISFRNDSFGRYALNWWADRCLEWCYAREEDGKFGDQKYLDDWTTRFQGVHVLQHLGGGVAPWNVQQYKVVSPHSAGIELRELASGIQFPLLFYHFHGLQIFCDGEIDLATYPLGQDFRAEVYDTYLDGLRDSATLLNQVSSEKNFHGLRERPTGVMERLRAFKRRWERRFDGALNVQQVRNLIQLR